MTNIELFVGVAIFIFGYLALIWKNDDFLNILFKSVFSTMAVWALVITIKIHLKTETENLKAEQVKLEQLRNITNSIPIYKVEK